MSDKYCHHIHANGAFCRSMPVGKRNYCYFHLQQLGRRMKAARARARAECPPFTLPLLEDLYSVQVALMQLAEAVALGDIEPRRAQLLLSILRVAASNLKAQSGWNRLRHFNVDESSGMIVVEHPGFEREYGLPRGFDLSVAPEEAFPPAQPPGQLSQQDDDVDAAAESASNRRHSRKSRELKKKMRELNRQKNGGEHQQVQVPQLRVPVSDTDLRGGNPEDQAARNATGATGRKPPRSQGAQEAPEGTADTA